MSDMLITGASGFVGRHLGERLLADGRSFAVAGRRNPFPDTPGVKFTPVDEIGPATDWSAALEGCGAIVHLGAQVPSPELDDSIYGRVNTQGTARLVQAAKTAGVRNIVFASSIFAVTGSADSHVVGDNTSPRPATAYGRSKLAAEAAIAEFADQQRTAISLRLPMVYGSNTKGNWHRLLELAALPVPLPFGAAKNRRSKLAVENAVDALLRAVDTATPEKSGTYAVSEGCALSLAEILTLLRKARGRSANLVPVPPFLLRMLLTGIGKPAMADSMLGSLVIDGSRFSEIFDWKPVIDTPAAMIATARAK